MGLTTLILYIVFVTAICVGIFILMMLQDKENRRMKALIDEKARVSQDNTKELEKFYAEKKQLQMDKDNEIAAIQAQLQDERQISALAVKNLEVIRIQLNEQKESELAQMRARLQEEQNSSALSQKSLLMVKVQVKQQQEDISQLKLDLQNISDQLQKAHETRLKEVQEEGQKWTETLQTKEASLQKIASEASSMDAVMDTLVLISKEMNRRLDDQFSKIKSLDQVAQDNLELIGQLEH